MPTNKKKLRHAYVPATALAKAVKFDAEMMHVYLTMDVFFSVAIIWFPLLHEATPPKENAMKLVEAA